MLARHCKKSSRSNRDSNCNVPDYKAPPRAPLRLPRPPALLPRRPQHLRVQHHGALNPKLWIPNSQEK